MIVFLIYFVVFVLAQDISLQQMELQRLEQSYAIEKSKLDSLNDNLQKLLIEIDVQKKQNSRDNDKISLLMADAHLVTKHVDKQSKVVNNLTAQIKKERLILYKKFTFTIDSLTQILPDVKDNQKIKVGSELRKLSQKRALVSPALPLFSFDVQLIKRINSFNTKDDLEKSIYMDYLANALAEVDSNIAVIKSKTGEVSMMIRLDEQAEDFIDEIDGAQFLSSIEIENEANRPFRFNDNLSTGKEFGLANAILIIYEQLELAMSELIETPVIANFDSLASDEYLMLLQGTEKTLKLYRKIIQEKMDKN